MFSTAMITLREGIEAFLIVAIALAYLRRTGREHLVPAVISGIVAGVLLSFVAGYFFGQAENKPFWEGTLAAVAAVLVASLTVYMWRTAKRMRADIGERLEAASARGGGAAWIGVFAFVLLMIVREGMETALLISVQLFQEDSGAILAGALAGTAGAALLAWAWSRYGQRVNLPRFFQVTAVFLLLFSVQLAVYAFHEFTEGGVVPGLDNEYWHLATEPYGPEGQYGEWLTYGMVLVPLAWLLLASLRDRAHAPRLGKSRTA
ncbi:MAG: FTR1 family protein [Burkholderiales bacterium]|nr:FTR1 family protein [Burkholderiales bacterium]